MRARCGDPVRSPLFYRPLYRPRCPSGATLALPGHMVRAGLYWAGLAGPSHAAVELRGAGGNYQPVTGTAAPGTGTLGTRGLAEIPLHQAFAEVTGLVARYGAGAWPAAAGRFSGSGLRRQLGFGLGLGRWAEDARPEGTGTRYLGWTLVVVAADSAAPAGQVMVLDGLRLVDPADPYVSASLGGQAAGRTLVGVIAATDSR